MSQSAHQQDRDTQDTASGSQLPLWGVIKRLFSFKTHSLSIGSWVARSLPPVELLSGSASCPTTPRFVSTLSLGPSFPSPSGGPAARLQLDTPAWGSAGTAGPRTTLGAGADGGVVTGELGPGSLESFPRVSPRTAPRLSPAPCGRREGGHAHGPAHARASLTGVQLLGGRAELGIFRDSVSNIRAFGRSA